MHLELILHRNDGFSRCYLRTRYHILLLILFGLGSCQNAVEQESEVDQFSRHVRTTEALSPDEERMALKVPPGFEVQLFASEPDIGKPLNMTFDSRGRMWLTQSYEYPFADTTGNPGDKISILEDTDGDGRADKIDVFADSLNIPIGIVAMQDGVVAYSIPHIYYFKDDNGDDQLDDRQILYSGFQYKDTHGMINNLIRGWDGWIHAGHGFSNTSTVAGTDGDTIVMVSGNTFRFREDGSHVEFTTTGRVNPFGYAYDELGYTYSVDCHTSPIYQLVKGADYPHFGKKPTGIGFGPAIMDHDYGATALAGLEYYLGNGYPREYQESFYYGDVVKCRVYRASIEMDGTTPQVTQEDDFVVSDDPWFRPVDVKMGPDGAIYIADFYNSIIGHYEVPLDHPGRDRQRGRIWRVVYTGDKPHNTNDRVDWSDASLDELISGLGDDRLPVRMSLADHIVDRFSDEAITPLTTVLNQKKGMHEEVQALWILYRLDALSDKLLADAHGSSNDTIRVHTLRIMYERDELGASMQQLARKALSDPNPHIVRQAVMVVSKHPDAGLLEPLLELRHTTSEDDSHLFYSIRQSLRDQLRQRSVLEWVLQQNWSEEDQLALADVMVGVDDPQAAEFIVSTVAKYPLEEEVIINYLKHAARYSGKAKLHELIAEARDKATDQDQAYRFYLSVQEGLDEAAVDMPKVGQEWAVDMATSFLTSDLTLSNGWKVEPNEFRRYNGNTWRTEYRDIPKTPDSVLAIISGPRGYSGNGISNLISPTFAMPDVVEFYMFGRKRLPGEDRQPTPPENSIELRLVDSDEAIEVLFVTEESVAQEVTWSGGDNIGKEVYLVVIDGSGLGGEYIGISNLNGTSISIPEYNLDQRAERQIFAATVAKNFGATQLEYALSNLLNSESEDVLARAAAGDALLSIGAENAASFFKDILNDDDIPSVLRERLLSALSSQNIRDNQDLLLSYLPGVSYETQKEIVMTMIGAPGGVDLILATAEAVTIPPRLLRERQIEEALSVSMTDRQKSRYNTIVEDVKPPSEEIQALIDERLRGYNPLEHDLQNGKSVENLFCSTCHQIDNEGGNIGPQLDGIGNWGAQALTEKILDPNRNISRAFVNYTIKMKDGKIHSGLFRREDGALQVFSNASGEEFSLPTVDISEKIISPYTLMPDHFGQIISEEDYFDLLAYLLSEK